MFPQIIRSETFFGERGDILLTRGEHVVKKWLTPQKVWCPTGEGSENWQQ